MPSPDLRRQEDPDRLRAVPRAATNYTRTMRETVRFRTVRHRHPAAHSMAHLDHCGRIPLLVKRGFSGEIITTSATRELARLVMLDSAHLHEEEARRRARKSHDKHAEGPLYDELDALNSFDCFEPHGAVSQTDPAGARHHRDLLRRRPHPRLGERAAGTERRRKAPAGAVFRRYRQFRPTAPARSGGAAEYRHGHHGNDLWRTATTATWMPPSPSSTTRSRMRTRAAATSSYRPSRSNAHRNCCSTCTRASAAKRYRKGCGCFLDSPMAISATRDLQTASGGLPPEIQRLFGDKGDPVRPARAAFRARRPRNRSG